MSFFLMAAKRAGGAGGGGGGGYTYTNDFTSGSLTPELTGYDTHAGVWPPDDGVFRWASSDPFVSTANKPTGTTHALAFEFPASTAPATSNREQNVSFGAQLGGFGQSIWMRWKLLVSANWVPRANFDGNTTAGPNKLFQFWSTDYGNVSGASTVFGATLQFNQAAGNCTWQAFATGNKFGAGATGIWQPDPQSRPNGDTFMAVAGSGSPGAVVPGVTADIKVKIQFATSWSAEDGYIHVYVDDEPHLIVGPVNLCNPEGPSGAAPILRGGYLMGFSNTGYTDATGFYWSPVTLTTVDPGWGF